MDERIRGYSPQQCIAVVGRKLVRIRPVVASGPDRTFVRSFWAAPDKEVLRIVDTVVGHRTVEREFLISGGQKDAQDKLN